VVGSKNFTEQVILRRDRGAASGAASLGVTVDRKLNRRRHSGWRTQALINGQIDLYPEYTGTALTAILRMPLSRRCAEVQNRVRAEYRHDGMSNGCVVGLSITHSPW